MQALDWLAAERFWFVNYKRAIILLTEILFLIKIFDYFGEKY
jgi:hypothetical protein